MKKVMSILILFLVVGAVFAADENKSVRIDAGMGIAASIYSAYITVTPEVLYDFGFFALGGGVKTYFGLPFADIYTAPYIMAELGWFYIGIGTSFMVKEPDPDTSETGFAIPEADSGLLPFGTIGLGLQIIPVGPGKLGVDVGVDFITSASPVEIVDDSESIIGDILGTLLSTAISAIVNSAKLGGSLFYSMQL